jgi:hypothetical protein
MATATKKARRAPAAQRGGGALKLVKNGPGATDTHVFGHGFRCRTEQRGHPTPRGRPPSTIVVDASEGFIPLWAKKVVLRWRFHEQSMKAFANPAAAKAAIRALFGEALLAWGSAAPVKFAQRDDAWDFEIFMMKADDCDGGGCVLASAFFPDAGRQELTLYPKLFEQTRKEQVETLVHEIGHIFGLRHFFANISENEWPSLIFGTHSAFTIMNYGSDSVLTPKDKFDLKRLYQLAWSGRLEEINGTPIRLMRPYHESGASPTSMLAVSEVQPVAQQPPGAAYV